MTERRNGRKKRFFDVFRRHQSSTPAQAPRPASPASMAEGSHRLTSLLDWPHSSPSLQIPRSRSLSSTRRTSTLQAVRSQADSLPGHPDARFLAGTSESDALSSRDQAADPGDGVEPTAPSESPSRMMAGLAIFKSALQITEKVADVFTPLKLAVGGLLGILEWVETVVDVDESFEHIANKVTLMAEMVEVYRSMDSLPSGSQDEMTKYLDKVAETLDGVKKIVQKKQDRKIVKRIVLAPADKQAVVDQLRDVDSAIELFLVSAHVKQVKLLRDQRQSFLMKQLDAIVSARHSAVDIPSCTKETRIQLLDDICAWAAYRQGKDTDARPIFILNGAAGTGKSTVAKTVCAALEEGGRLGGSYFCSRGGKAGQRDVKSIFPTLAYTLSQHSPAFAAEVAKALEKDPDAAKAVIKEQFRVLIAKPAEVAFTTADTAPVVVIDAVDELEWPRSNNGPTPHDLLDIIVDQAPQLHLKFFVTSRPEDGLRDMFGPPDSDSRKHVRLHDIDRHVVDADIRGYLTAELDTVGAFREDISALADRSEGLFIYAATACKYIKARNVSVPQGRRLQILISSRANAPTGIDKMYEYILEQALEAEGTEAEMVLRCLHAVLCARNPLSVTEVAHLLRLTDPEYVRCALVALHSVISVPDRDDLPVTTYHASFADYLITRTRSGSKRWAADTGATHRDLFLGCFEIMNSSLRFNVSGCGTSYASNAKQPSRQDLPSYLVYACRFWIEHLTMSSISEEQATQDVCAFFGKQFLYWLEVLSVCDHAKVASLLVKRLEVWLRDKQTEPNADSTDVLARCLRILQDAYDFLIRFRRPILHSVPHIYISALAFTPPESEIGQAYLGLLERRLKVDTARQLTPLPLLDIHEHSRTLHMQYHRALAFSADSRCIVSAADCDVCRWDARTGESIGQPQQGPDIPHSRLALSPDGSRAVSWSESTGCVWDTTLDHPIGRSLKVPTDATSVSLVVFSPDGKCVAAAGITMAEGRDFVICKWDAATGDPIGQPLELAGSALKGGLSLIAFAPDYKRIAATYPRDNLGLGKLTLWDAETGAAIVEEFADVNSAVFSPDSAFVVYGELGGAIHARDAETGDAIGQPLNGHTMTVCSLAFSLDGKFIASGSFDTTVRVWSFEHGRLAGHRVLKGHTASVESVVFSLDGHLLASTSSNGDICIWDAAQNTTGHTNPIGERSGHIDVGVEVVAFSPNGRQLASASRDGTVCIWDAHTGAAVGEPLLGLGHDCGCWPVAIAFLVDDNKTNLVSCSTRTGVHRGPAINVWDVEAAINPGEWSHKGYWGKDGRACALSPDGKRIALGLERQEESSIEIVESATCAHVVDIDMSLSAPYEGDAQADYRVLKSATFSLDGRFIAVCFNDATIQVWETDTGTRFAPPLEVDKWRGGSVALSPDGKLLAYPDSRSEHRNVRIWNPQTHIEQSCMEHTGVVTSLAFSPNGKHVASASWDDAVRVWDVQTGDLVLPPLRGHTRTVWSVAFSPDARHIATCGRDKSIRIWDVTVGASHAPQIVTGSDSPSLIDLWESHGAGFDMSYNGWIIGPQEELFLWTPPEYRTGLSWPRMTAVMGMHPVRLDLRQFAHGSTWTECWSSA
ncbi:quinon protein alcohol dehydrogenase-like superfamily [Rhodofomes roseus]|uniref:Quinon protein alcohol dehydrogenase-like superfamily n=1 Tax=Rhodofomes roseus TaxID=34475 RepID=A0ABQ8KBV1_9APHY|nr:quinon protein alcohol dehydrogenase-like superfamily [Rhodofomes roseus]KAH9834934.1 quinon protein alcohol dehydrogenase-like superfamily [Rhodofomes roseus]